jgi:glycosyltransferase involved in cell wall biosynthesis
MKRERGRIWVLNELYYPEDTGTGYYTTRVAEHWARSHDVAALCSQPSYSKAGLRAPRHEVHNGVEVFRCWSILPRRDGIPARLLKMASIALSMFVNAIFRMRKGDCMYVVTSPPSLMLAAPLIAKIRGVRYVIQLCDLYPEITAACGLTTTKSLTYRILKRLCRASFRGASRIVAVGRDVQARVSEARGTATSEGICYIPWWADTEEIRPVPKSASPLINTLKLADRFVVLYAGNMGYPQNIEAIAEAVKRLASEPQIHFLCIGFGPKKKILDELVTAGATNLTVLSQRPREEQQDFLNACDVALVSLVQGMQGIAVPSRSYNLMAAGKPMIALVEDSSEIAQVIREHDIGWVVGPDDPSRTVSAILAARQHPELLKKMGEAARSAAETRFARSVLLAQFDNVITELA